MRAAAIGRVLAVAVAIGAVLWLADSLRAVRLDQQGNAATQGAKTAAQIDHALSLFRQATSANADPTPRIDEAKFLLSLGRTRQTINVLDPVLRANPGNVAAWDLLDSAAAGSDLAVEARANQQLGALFGHPFVDYAGQLTVFSPIGTIGIQAGSVIGSVDAIVVSGGRARFVGWAAKVSKTSAHGTTVTPADQIVIVANGRFVAVGTPTGFRPDVSRRYRVTPVRVGFDFSVPVATVRAEGDRLAFYASSQGVGARLPLSCRDRRQPLLCTP